METKTFDEATRRYAEAIRRGNKIEEEKTRREYLQAKKPFEKEKEQLMKSLREAHARHNKEEVEKIERRLAQVEVQLMAGMNTIGEAVVESKLKPQEESKDFLVELAELALNYGFVPIPLTGKKPIYPAWQKTTANSALAKIKQAVQQGIANNIGVLTGEPSGVVVVDVDASRGGLDFWNELIKNHPIPKTLTVKTGSGGLHYYFLYDDKTASLRNATTAIKGRGIDLKTNGGQVVFPGSTHPETGHRYEIIDGLLNPYTDQEEIVIAPMPDWLFDLLQTNQAELNKRYPRKYL